MKTFVLTVDVPNNGVRDSVHIANMLRAVTDTIEFQVPVADHHHVYDRYGVQQYEWTLEDVPERAAEKRRAV